MKGNYNITCVLTYDKTVWGNFTMHRNDRIFKMVTAAMLCAIGIIIPMICPKISIEPASFTLASHVALFLAMFLSPKITLAVWFGTTLGFQLTGMPPVVVMRAASQIVFAMLGAVWLQKDPHLLQTKKGTALFALVTGVVHGFMEIIAVLPFYFSGSLSEANYQKGFLISVFLLVGVGTVVHSIVDFAIARVVYQPVSKMSQIKRISTIAQ